MRFERHAFSISCVLSVVVYRSTPPASNLLTVNGLVTQEIKQCCETRYARHSSRVTAWLEYRGLWCKTTRPAILSLVVLGHRNEKRVFLPGELLPRVWLRRRSRLVGLYNSLDGTAQHYTLPRIVIIVVSCCVIELHSVAAPQNAPHFYRKPTTRPSGRSWPCLTRQCCPVRL